MRSDAMTTGEQGGGGRVELCKEKGRVSRGAERTRKRGPGPHVHVAKVVTARVTRRAKSGRAGTGTSGGGTEGTTTPLTQQRR
jgi:hypothetical protein